MKKYLVISFIITAFLFSTNAKSQSFILENISQKKPDRTFNVSNKSRKLKLKKGDTYEIKMKLKNYRLYYISVCGNKAFNNIQYQLKMNNNKNEIMYDNAAYEFDKNNTFRVEKDTTIVIKIKTQPSTCLKCDKKKRKVKVFIAYKNTKRHEERNNIPNLLAMLAKN